MRLERIRVRNFRSLKDVKIDLSEMAVLVGANGTGKSNILEAVRLFQSKAVIEEDDFYGRDTGNEVSIELAFGGIEDRSQLEPYVHDGTMNIKRVFTFNDGGVQSAFYGRLMQHPQFRPMYSGTATDARKEYPRFVDEYDLPAWTNHGDAKSNMRRWERNHPDQCEACDDDGKFFTAKTVPDQILRVIFVPAVRDATAEAEDGRDSSFAQLMKEVTGTIKEDAGYKKFKESAGRRYRKLMDKFSEKQLQDLGSEINKELAEIIGGVEVELSWQDHDLPVGLPHTTVRLKENGSLATVDRSGHGSQRAFIMAMLQHLAKRDPPDGGGRPATVLLIEEPELYQHPTRQRLLARVFGSLARRGVMQIMYATHSPHFVGIDRIDHVRLLRKRGRRAGHRTEISSTSIRDMHKRLKVLSANNDEKYLRELLGVIMTPWINEGFFASLVVLVEGPTDYAAIMATSRLAGEDMEKSGIAVIPCGGKSNILPLAVMFRLLRIPCYPVWDGDDQGDQPNGKIWQAVGSANTQPGIADEGACLEGNLDQTLEREIGKDLLDRLRTKAKRRYHIYGNNKQVMSKSRIMYDILQDAAAEDKPCESLNKIVKRIKQAYAACQEEPRRTRAKRRR